MKYLLLVSHGNYSAGLKQTLSMFAGEETTQTIIAVGLNPDESASTLGKQFDETLKTLPEDAEFVVLADIIGGSPLTTVCDKLNDYGKLQNTLVLGGMNFPMALTVALSKDSLDNAALKEKAKEEAVSAIKEFATSAPSADDDEI